MTEDFLLNTLLLVSYQDINSLNKQIAQLQDFVRAKGSQSGRHLQTHSNTIVVSLQVRPWGWKKWGGDNRKYLLWMTQLFLLFIVKTGFHVQWLQISFRSKDWGKWDLSVGGICGMDPRGKGEGTSYSESWGQHTHFPESLRTFAFPPTSEPETTEEPSGTVLPDTSVGPASCPQPPW